MFKYSLLLIVTAVLAAGIACNASSKEKMSIEEFLGAFPSPTHPVPTSTSAVQGASRLATLVALTAPTPDPTHVRELWLTATVAIATAQSGAATALADGASAEQVAEATASRAIANSAKLAAIAISVPQPTLPPPDFMLTTIADSSTRETEKAVEQSERRNRTIRCNEANAIRRSIATADTLYSRRGVSLGELSVFKPKEATARADSIDRANALCP